MTIAQTSREIKELINDKHVYAAECIINALVDACENELYLDKQVLIEMIKKVR